MDVIIVDDEPGGRRTLLELCADEADLRVIGDYGDGHSALAAIRARLRPGAPLFATFGSTRDPRFGRGTRVDAATYAPDDGAESGVPHAFFDAERLRSMPRRLRAAPRP